MCTDEDRFLQIKRDSNRWEGVLKVKNKCAQIKIYKCGEKISGKWIFHRVVEGGPHQ